MFVKPSLIVADITTIDLMQLWQAGIRGFIFDLDNTIMAPNTGRLDHPVSEWLEKVKETGFHTIVVSNNPIASYTIMAEKVLNMPVLGNAGKPRRRILRKALELIKLEPFQVAVVGDRPLTDILGGQRLGAMTILVDPLTKHQEHQVVQWLRKLERFCIYHD